MPNALTGTVKWYNTQKKYGFIIPDTGGKDMFVHERELEKSGLSGLQENQRVSYAINEFKGKQSAIDIKIIG